MSKKGSKYTKNGKSKKNGGYNNNAKGKRSFREDQEVTSKENDPGWYNSNNQLSFDAGSYSFNTGLGTEFTFNGSTTSVPGVCAIGIIPMPCVQNRADEPINVTARALFSNVLRANSRSNPDYEAADLMIYLMAVANAWSLLYWARRVYGLCNVYSQYNRYIPEALLIADGIDFEDILHDMAGFRYEINAYATQLATYCVPKDIPYFQRMAWLFSNVYMDEPTSRAGLYIYHPETFGVWKDNGTNGSQLDFMNWAVCRHPDGSDVNGYTGTVTPSLSGRGMFVEAFKMVLSRLHDSTDVNNMSGDILKAYGPENMLLPDTIPADYAVVPEYVPEVLMQIHNTTLLGTPVESDWEVACLTQDERHLNLYSSIVLNPMLTGDTDTLTSLWGSDCINAVGTANNNHFLDIMKESPTSDDVLVATRLKSNYGTLQYTDDGGTNKTGLTASNSGAEIATTMYIVKTRSSEDFGPAKRPSGTGYHADNYSIFGPFSSYSANVADEVSGEPGSGYVD